LLVESKLGFAKAHGSDSALSLLVPVKNSSPPKKDKGWIAVTLGTAMVLTQIINVSVSQIWPLESRKALEKFTLAHLHTSHFHTYTSMSK
jgi:hypothetical protein